jgi:hypothetical protein
MRVAGVGSRRPWPNSSANGLHPALPPQLPVCQPGTVSGAQRFFQQVLEGAALDRRERIRPEIPVMAGLSNWTIALDVFTRMPEPRAKPEESR